MSPKAAFEPSDPLWRDRVISFAVAACCHAAVFALGGAALVPPEYGIEAGGGGIEVNLVAALPQAAVGTMPGQQAEAPSRQDDHDAVLAQSAEPILAATPNPSPGISAQQTTSSSIGDGSSAVPGPDATTRYHPGAWTNAKPSRFRNPAPPYPELARQQGQEGLVILVVTVDATGRPVKVILKQSSGFPLLDEAATTAVSRWRCTPGQAGGAPIESVVETPIRFRLADER